MRIPFNAIVVFLLTSTLFACDSGSYSGTDNSTENTTGNGTDIITDSVADNGTPPTSIDVNSGSAPIVAGANEIPTDNAWFKPSIGSSWQWQLTGEINASYDVTLYDIDLFDSSAQFIAELQAQGRRVVCYFSAGTFENWRPDASQFPEAVIGTVLPDFPAERWLDIRTDAVEQVMLARLALAKQKGCDAVEPDNVDGYINDNGFAISAGEQLGFNRWLAQAAHDEGLAVGLKNNVDQVAQLVNAFDFVISEQCFEYNECDRYMRFIDAGKPVFNVEYPDTPVGPPSVFKGLCEESARLGITTLIMPVELDDRFRIDCRDILSS